MTTALVVLSAKAQQPTPLPHVRMTIPLAPPRGWDAKQWASLRARCQSLADRAAARIPYANRQEMEDAEMCMELAPLPASATREPAYLQATLGGSPRPTPAALLNPNWCSEVPASPPPPNLEHHPGDWAALRERCMSTGPDRSGLCSELCQDAKDRWKQQKAGLLSQPSTFPSPTDQPLGPFPLPGGGSGYILPAQPAPRASG